MTPRFALTMILAPILALTGCGLSPVYSDGRAGTVSQNLGGIAVSPIDSGKVGWLVQNALNERLANDNATSLRLDVKLDDKIEGFGVRADDAVTRERRSLRARYQLIDQQGIVLLDATSGSDISIDVVASDYATIAAENAALERLSGIVADQIVARLALFARRPKN
jgi:LPS-assembly lipoprotein